MSVIEQWECDDCGKPVPDVRGHVHLTTDGYVTMPATLKRYVPADEHAGAVEALRWYADPDNYDAIGPHGTVKGPAWRVVADNGERARRALGGQ